MSKEICYKVIDALVGSSFLATFIEETILSSLNGNILQVKSEMCTAKLKDKSPCLPADCWLYL